MHEKAPQIALEADDVVIDGAPRVAALARSALLAADLVLIPVQPSAYDVWASHEMVQLIAEDGVFRPQLRAAFVINRRAVGTVIVREARSALTDQPFAALSAEISLRIVFADSGRLAGGRLACEAAATLRGRARDRCTCAGSSGVAAMTTPPIAPRRRAPIGHKPASDPASAWIRQIDAPDAPDAPDASARPAVYTARLTIDVTPAMRGRIESTAFERRVTASHMLRELLERAFRAGGGVTQPEPDRHPLAVQRGPRTVPAARLTCSRVSLAFVAHRLNVWPRLGKPARETVLDRWRCVAAFVRGATGGRARRVRNAYRTALWTLMVRQAPAAIDGADDCPRTGRAMCCARILWRVDGAKHVGAVLNRIQAIEASGTEPCAPATNCRRIIANRLVSRLAPTEFAVDPCAVRHARGAPQ